MYVSYLLLLLSFIYLFKFIYIYIFVFAFVGQNVRILHFSEYFERYNTIQKFGISILFF